MLHAFLLYVCGQECQGGVRGGGRGAQITSLDTRLPSSSPHASDKGQIIYLTKFYISAFFFQSADGSVSHTFFSFFLVGQKYRRQLQYNIYLCKISVMCKLSSCVLVPYHMRECPVQFFIYTPSTNATYNFYVTTD
jgi:hypothetical protein